MEGHSAYDFANDDSNSSGAASSGEPGRLGRDSQTTCFLPSLQGSTPSDEASLALEEERAQRDGVYSTSPAHANLLDSQNSFQEYQPLTAHEARSPQASHDGLVDPVDKFEPPVADPGSHWRPAYLRRRVLAAFSAVFLLMIVALELLSVISNRNYGIATGFNKDHYLWTYGPTAFLTLIAALFNRVEYQAKIMAPWERLSKHPAPARKTLLLDYVSPLQPVAIFDSLRNKDSAVAATTTVSLLIKLLIVLSSGLITLSRIGVHHGQVRMEIQNAFVDDAAPFRAENSVPYFILQGLIEGSDYPPGISNKFAFQSVQSQLPDTAQYQVMVDGLTMNLECESAKLDITGSYPTGKHYDRSSMNLTITSPSCDVALDDSIGPDLISQDQHEPHSPAHEVAFGKFETVQCDGTTDDAGKRVLIMTLLEESFVNESIPIETITPNCTSRCKLTTNVRGRLLNSAQLLCTPTYEIVRVNVVQNGTEVQSVLPAYPSLGKSSSRTMDRVSPWKLIEAYFNAFDTVISGISVSKELNFSEREFLLDKYMYNLMESQVANETEISSLYDPKFSQSVATTYFQQAGAIIANQLLLQPGSLNTTGSAVIWEDRLIVREWAVQWMAALIAFCLILSIFTAFITSQHGIIQRSPSSLPGIAVLIADSTDLLERLRYSGDATSKALDLQLKGSEFHSAVFQGAIMRSDQPCQFFAIVDVAPASTNNTSWSFHQSESPHSHPWILHPVSRLSLGFILVLLIITVEVTLRQSSSHDGLGDVGENAYIHYTWTSIPALVFGGLAITISSIDFNIRSLAPFSSLSDAVTAEAFKTLDFLDMSVPSAIIKEAKMRNIGALATTTTLLFASFFTIFSGSLFQGVSFPSTSFILLRTIDSFGPTSSGTSVGVNAPLILLGNLTYPSSTYEDLAFPQFLPTTTFTPEVSHESLLYTKAVVPALRSHLECRFYDKSMIRVRFEHKTNDSSINGPPDVDLLMIAVDHEDCVARGDTSFSNAEFSIFSNTSYFGVDTASPTPYEPHVNFYDGCSHYTFIWGKVDPFAESKIEHIAAMGCNQSIEAVDVETNFIGADLAIDRENPPRVVPGTERNVTASLDSGFAYPYDDAPRIPTNDVLSSIFALLTQSRWAIPLSMLGGGSDDIVIPAIKFQHGIFLAQALNKARVPAAETNITLTREQALAGENDAGRTFEATVVDKAGRQRVVQDAVSTRVLEALLLATLILLGVGWVWLPKTNVLPKRSPMTIASAIALLAGGNLEEWVHEMDSDATGAKGGQASTTRFWMGWGNVPDEEGILMGNENENGVSRFGIFAVKGDHVVGGK